MIIAVSSAGPDINSRVDVRFGRCPYFIIVETVKKEIKSHRTIENISAGQVGGAGMSAAQRVADAKADAVITGNIGPRAFRVFQQLGIDVYQGSGTVKGVVEEMLAGNLVRVRGATGPGHMGMPGGGRGKTGRW